MIICLVILLNTQIENRTGEAMSGSFFFSTALLPGGWSRNVRVEVVGELIQKVTAGVNPGPEDKRAGTAVPGVPNVHSHAFQRAMAGLAERRGPGGADSFWSWRDVMYRFLARLDAEDVEAIAAYAYADMLEAGFTSVAEFHYLHRDPAGRLYVDPAELARRHLLAADRTGIGITLLPVLYQASDFGGAPPTPAQHRFVTDLDTFAVIIERLASSGGDRPGRKVGVAPHSLRAVPPEQLRALLDFYPRGPVHIHVSEQLKEVTDCLAWSGLRPVEWLFANANIDSRWCLVHATHLTEAEIICIGRSGAVVGLCPVTEANLGDGIFPAAAFLAAKGTWGIGTDSNVCVDAAGELRLLGYAQRLQLKGRNVLAADHQPSTGGRLFRAALHGGALALGQGIGAIAAGLRADIVVLDDRRPDLEGRVEDAILDTWIFSAGRPLVRDVIVGGKTVVENGRHSRREEIDCDYRSAVRRLMRNTGRNR
jgi:formiminoglutamate deiminase